MVRQREFVPGQKRSGRFCRIGTSKHMQKPAGIERSSETVFAARGFQPGGEKKPTASSRETKRRGVEEDGICSAQNCFD